MSWITTPRIERAAVRVRRSAALAPVLLGTLGFVVYAAVRPTRAEPARYGHLAVWGQLTVPLRPGTSQPLNLRLGNRYPFAVEVTSLVVRVSVDATHRNRGCVAARDFVVSQLPQAAYPVHLQRSSNATLRTLHVRTLPRLGMANLPDVNQDGCQGASLVLHYRASAMRAAATRRAAHRRGGAR